MKTNYVLIDYENLQPTSLSALDQEHFKVLVFVGANQNKLSFELAHLMQRLGNDRGRYIKASSTGSNALDFHIAFYIGQLAAADPTAFFHIISKDTGFDPLVAHLKSLKIFSARSADVLDMPIFRAVNAKALPEQLASIVANLRQRGTSKPRSVKTLSSTIASLFQKKLSDAEVAETLKALQDRRFITINGSRVSYSLPQNDT